MTSSRGPVTSGRTLVAVSVVLSVAAAGFALFGPTGMEETQEAVPGGVDEPGRVTERRWTSTWGQIEAGEEDRFVLIVLAFPVVVALGALALESTRLRRGSRAGAAVLLTGFAVVTGFSVGLFFLPGAVAMVAAALARPGSPARRGAPPA